MTAITLEAVKAKQDEIAEMIAKIEADLLKPAFFEYQGEHIPLRPGETYVGTIIVPAPGESRHLIKMPGELESTNWHDAMNWAASIGGELPDRVESALAFATMKSDFCAAAYWTRETHPSDSDYAFYQNFSNGLQDNSRKNNKLRARAFRRLIIQ